jgi:hypothetical protein
VGHSDPFDDRRGAIVFVVRVRAGFPVLLLVSACLSGAVVARAGAASSVAVAATATSPNPALTDLAADARYTGTGTLAAAIANGSHCPLRVRDGVSVTSDCRSETVPATISFTVAPDKSEITGLSTDPVFPSSDPAYPPLVSDCGALVQSRIPLTSRPTRTTTSGRVATRTSLTFSEDGFTFSVSRADSGRTRRTVTRTIITGAFPATGTAHLDVLFELREADAEHKTYSCLTRARFSVQTGA